MKTRMRNLISGALLVILMTAGIGHADLSTDLVGYWCFDNPGDLGYDCSGTGNNGSPVGGATPTSGVLDGAVHFDGTGYISVPDSASLDLPAGGGTIAGFIRIDPSSTMSNEFGVSKESSSSYPWTIAYEFLIRESATGKWIEYYVLSDGTSCNYIGNDDLGSLKDSLWHHIAMTWSGPGGKVLAYRDGVVVAQCDQTISTLNNIGEPLLIGAYRWNVPPGILRRMRGDMDEVRIYSRALSESEIQQLAGTTIPVIVDIKPGSCPNPLNIKDKGLLSVAILGSEVCDVSTVDITSIRLEGVAPARSSYEDMATPMPDGAEVCECTTTGPDGHLDLVLKFNIQNIVAVLGPVNNGNELALNLTGALNDGTLIEGTDCVVIQGAK